METAATNERHGPDPADAGQEVEVWWGGYFQLGHDPQHDRLRRLDDRRRLVALALFSGSWLRFAIVGPAALIWLVQVLRWGEKFFGTNYRLTNCRLFKEKGIFSKRLTIVPLALVKGVFVHREGRRMTTVGHILVFTDENKKKPYILDGVRDPGRVAERIREAVKKAKTP